MGVLTDNIPPRRRGWIFGLRSLFMGLGGILTGLGTSWVLHHWGSPVNFRISFMICDTLWTLSSLCLFLIRDRPARAARKRAASFLPSLVGKLRILLANPNYRIFLFFHMLNSVALTIATFIVPYAQDRLGAPDSLMTWLSVIYLASSAALGSLMGWLADKAGYRSVGAVQSFLLVVFFMIAVASRSFVAVCIGYVLYSIVNMTSAFMLVNMSVELCPSLGRHRPHRARRDAPSSLHRGLLPAGGDDHRQDRELSERVLPGRHHRGDRLFRVRAPGAGAAHRQALRGEADRRRVTCVRCPRYDNTRIPQTIQFVVFK